MRKYLFARLLVLVILSGAFGINIAVPPCTAEDKTPSEAREKRYSQLDLFVKVRNDILKKYADEVDEEELFYGSLKGMVEVLDPYSQFLTPDEFSEMQVDTSGQFGGLGVEIFLDSDKILTVQTPLMDTPAYFAGVLAGDKIIKIDGVSTEDLSLKDAVKKLRGPVNSPVTITVYHQDQKDIEDITIIRDIIKVASIQEAKIVDQDYKIGVINLSTFSEQSLPNLKIAIEQLLAQGMKALILDLRNNPGGLLDASVDVADLFINEGMIVSTRGRPELSNQAREYKAREKGTYPYFPMAVLINKGSASASEIVAGALQDHGRAVIIGSQSFGKGSVQSVYKYASNAALRLTTAHYYTPSGRNIHKKGIEPDIVVDQSREEILEFIEARRQAKVEHNKLKQDEEALEDNPSPVEDEGETEKDAPEPVDSKEDQTDENLPDILKNGIEEEKKPFVDRPLDEAVKALKAYMILNAKLK